MKSGISIYIRNNVIQLSRPSITDGKKVYKRVSTKLPNNPENISYVKSCAETLFLELTEQLNKSDVTFKVFVPYALTYINGFCKKETADERVGKIEKYLFPTFGAGRIALIKSKDIEKWQLSMVQEHGADLTRRCKQLLKRIFYRAVVEEVVTVNPVEGTATIRQPKQKLRKIYSKEEVSLILQHADGWLKVFILLLATGGVRTGEASLIMRKDVDLTRRTIKIDKSLRRGQINPPKGDERLIDMNEMLYQAMNEYLASYHGEYLFSPDGGKQPFYDGATFTKRHFQPVLKKIGVEYKSLYSLRHTFATLQLSGGNDLVYISNQLGHKEVSTTSKFYIKYVKSETNINKSNKILDF